MSVGKLIETIAGFMDIKELSAYILAKLTDRILVGHKEIIDGQPQQQITIVWRFVEENLGKFPGAVNRPLQGK